MKQKSRKILFLIITKGMSFLLIAFIFIGAFSSFAIYSGSSLIKKRFQGNRAEYQGVISLWCVSEFESGTKSKLSYLENVALEFEKQNKGAYVLISSYTVSECIIQLENKNLPDIFCFSGNVGKIIQNYLTEVEELSEVNSVLLNSARLSGGELIAYPYMLGGYVLISSKKRLEDADLFDYNSLFSNAMNLGYEKKMKKSTRNIYSICYGTKNGNTAFEALVQEANVRGVEFEKNNLSIHENVGELTSYKAYSRWINNESVVLLGTQRDLSRIISREKSGRESDFIVDYISYFSDILDYVGVTNNKDLKKLSVARAFSKFLLSDNMQNKLKDIGLFKTTIGDCCLYEDKYFMQMEKSLKHLNIVPNIFI